MTTQAKQWGILHNAQRRATEILLKGFAIFGGVCLMFTVARIALYLVENY